MPDCMKKLCLVLLFSVSAHTWGWCQLNTGIIELAKIYRQFMFRNDPPESVVAGFDKYAGTELAFAADFIRETVKQNSAILSEKYLMRPSDQDLKLIYVVIRVNYNLAHDSPKDNNEVIEDLMKSEILTEDLVNSYYSTIFAAYGNKVKPFDLSSVDFQLNNYGLKNDTEKAIFFLASMHFNGLMIWGYINIAKPPRYEEAMKFIEKYPKYNGSPYFQFQDLAFPDFKIKMEWKGKPESYKAYYIDKYYDVLLNHLTYLNKMGADQERIYDLALGSILVNKNYYQYSKREKELKKLFTTYKK